MGKTVPREMADIMIIFPTTENSVTLTCFLKEENQIPFKPKGFQAQWDEWYFEKQELPPHEGYSEKKEKFKGREGEVYLEEVEVLPQALGLELFPEIQLSLKMHEGVGGSFQTDIVKYFNANTSGGPG